MQFRRELKFEFAIKPMFPSIAKRKNVWFKIFLTGMFFALIIQLDLKGIVKSKTKEKDMENNAKAAMFLTLTMMGLGVYGCGTPKVVTTGVPSTAENNEAGIATPEAQPQSAPMEKYVIQKGDTLWAISGKTEIYADSFQWPLIFKANRDLIQDPDLIYPDQKLTIDKSVSEAETKNAEKLAGETPKYV